MDPNIILVNSRDMSIGFDIEDIYLLQKTKTGWKIKLYNRNTELFYLIFFDNENMTVTDDGFFVANLKENESNYLNSRLQEEHSERVVTNNTQMITGGKKKHNRK